MKQMLKIIAALVALELVRGFCANAQGLITFVSTLNAPSGGSMQVASDSWLAQGFYTGANTSGYVLDSVDLRLATAAGNPKLFTLLLYDSAGIFPGNLLGQLSGSLNPAGAGDFKFTASQLSLSPLTAYYIVATASKPLSVGAYTWMQPAPSTNPPFETVGGWEFGNAASSQNGSDWERIGNIGRFQFAVSAAEIPEPSALALSGLGGLLLATVRKRRWASHNGCRAATARRRWSHSNGLH